MTKLPVHVSSEGVNLPIPKKDNCKRNKAKGKVNRVGSDVLQ